jgi:hypothetical protein
VKKFYGDIVTHHKRRVKGSQIAESNLRPGKNNVNCPDRKMTTGSNTVLITVSAVALSVDSYTRGKVLSLDTSASDHTSGLLCGSMKGTFLKQGRLNRVMEGRIRLSLKESMPLRVLTLMMYTSDHHPVQERQHLTPS